jgi:steroid delta-isomerase-like uncharacterized protein
MPDPNRELISRFLEEAWNHRNAAICDELLSPDHQHHMPGASAPAVGPAAYKQLIEMFTAAFPDTRFEIKEVFGEGDRVCVLWEVHATHQGVFNGIRPTQRNVTVPGVGVCRVRDGKIVEMVSLFDNASFAKQLDADAGKAAEAW